MSKVKANGARAAKSRLLAASSAGAVLMALAMAGTAEAQVRSIAGGTVVSGQEDVLFSGTLSTFTPYVGGAAATSFYVYGGAFSLHDGDQDPLQYFNVHPSSLTTEFRGSVTHGSTTLSGRNAYFVTWSGVPYWWCENSPEDCGGISPTSTFQFVLYDRSDTGTGNYDFEYNYGSLGEVALEGSASAGTSTGPNGSWSTAVNPQTGTNVGTTGRWLFTFRGLSMCPTLSTGNDDCSITSASVISGTADALGGSDAIRLGGSTDFTFDGDSIGTNFLNFEQVRKVDFSTVTLDGSVELPVYVGNGTLQIAGSVTNGNGGAIEVDGAGATVEVLAGGSVTTTNPAGAGVFFTAADGTLANAGTISGYYGAYFNGQGSVTNAAGGVITGGHTGVYMATGSVTNTGTISGGIDGVRIAGAGTVTNQAGGLIQGAENGVQIDGAGTVTNAGTIRTNGPSGNWPAVYIGGGGTVNNLAGGLIDGGAASTGVYITGGAGVVDNAGTVTSEQVAIYFAGAGTVTNQAGGLIDSPFNAVNIQGAGTVTNYGTIRDSSATGGNYPVLFFGAGAAVTNGVGGLIHGTHGTAVYNRSGDAQLDNFGTINGGTAGPAVRFDGGGRVTNTGTIAAAGTGGIDIRGGAAQVTNSGQISSAGAGSYGVALSGGGTLTNQSGGAISGAAGGVLLSGSGAYTVDLQQGSTTGTIVSTGDGARTVTIAGTLTGDYNAGAASGVDVVTLAATGAMGSGLFGGGDDVFNFQGGAFSALDGGAGTDTFNAVLGAGNSASMDIGNVSNFEALNLISGALTVTGSRGDLPNWMLSSGTTLNLAGATSGGMISANGGTTVNVTGSHVSTVGGSAVVFGGANVILTNSGSLTASAASAVHLFAGGTVDNQAGGLIEGSLGIDSGGPLTLTNAGTITGTGGTAVQTNGGAITNAATGVINGGTAVFNNGAGDLTIDNSGTFNGQVATSGTGVLTLTNRQGASIIGVNSAVDSQGGRIDVDNAGTIQGGSWGVVGRNAGDIVENSGLITAGSEGVTLTAGGQVYNGGDIHGGWRGVYLGAGGGTVDNLAGALIDGNVGVWTAGGLTLDNAGEITGLNGNAVYVSAGGGAITNSGAMSSAGTDYNAVYVVGAGSLDNKADATITGGYDGVFFSGLADVDNAGTITGQRANRAGLWLNGGGTVDNLAGGTFSGAGHGVVSNGAAATAVTNVGTITGGTGYGVYLLAGSVDNQQGGLIQGGYRGVYVGGTATVTNAGTIAGGTDNGVTFAGAGSSLTNTATGVITAGRTTAGWGVFGAGSMSVDNAGEIDGETGVVFWGGGTLLNREGGVIDGRLHGVLAQTAGTVGIENAGAISGDYGVYLGVAGQIANVGTITGDTNAGVRFADAGAVLVNTGSITSVSGVGVLGGSGVDLVESSGLIGGGAGAVDLGAGEDVLTLLSGATLQGRVDGGEGSDLLTLAGEGAGTLDVSQLANFESQQKVGTGTWTLTGAAANQVAWGVASGVLRLSGGQAVGDDATVTVNATGTLEVATDETVGELLTLGAVTGTGTLTADAYRLFGGVVSANLGAGELYVHGSTTLNGTSGASVVEIMTGTNLTIGADERLSDTATLLVDGALDLGAFDDTIGEAVFNGALAGTGTLSADLVELRGASLGANLDTDLLLQASGVSTITGTVTADEIGVVTGTLALAGDERLWDGSLLQIEEGAIFDLNGWDETVGELWGEGTVQLDGGAFSFGFGGGDSAFGGVFAGEGSLTKVGGGRFILNADQTFAGPLNVDAGELLLNADLAGDLIVRGGTLSGWGEIGGALRMTGGAMSPGMGDGEGSLGAFFASSLTVTGGTLGFGFAGADQDFASDYIGVTGLVSLGGGVIDARPVSAIDQYGFNQGYLLIDGGSLNGQFANLSEFTQNAYAPELWQRLRYDVVEGGVVLEVRRQIDWTGDAETGTQSLVAQALENVQMNGDDAWAEIMNALVELTPEQRREAFEDMSGEGLANVTTSAAQFGDGFQSVMQGRMGPAGGGAGGMSGPTGTAFAALPFGQGSRTDVLAGVLNVAEAGATGAAGAWAEAFLVNSELEGRGGAVDTDTDGGGFAAGFDVDVGGGWRLGVASGYSDMKGETSDRSTTSDGTFWHVGVYAGWEEGPWYAGGALSRLSGDVSTDRAIGVGPITLDVAGATEVESLNLSAAFGRRFQLSEKVELDAGVTANGSRIRQDAYTETGAGGLSLNVDEVERTLWVTELGARLTRDSQGGKLRPYVGAGAAFAAGDLDSLTSVGFSGAPDASGGFLVAGAELPPAWATLEAGLAFRPSDRVWVQLGYDGALADRLKDHRGGVKVSVRW